MYHFIRDPTADESGYLTLSCSAPRPAPPLPPKLAFALPPPGGLKQPPRPATLAPPALDLLAPQLAAQPGRPPAVDLLNFLDAPAVPSNSVTTAASFDPFALAAPVSVQLPSAPTGVDPFAALPSLASKPSAGAARTASGGSLGSSVPARPNTLDNVLNDSLAKLML